MTIADDIGHLAEAAQRIAVALEKLAGPPEQHPVGLSCFASGELIAIPVADRQGYSPISLRPWHAADVTADGTAAPRCGVKAHDNLSKAEACALTDVPPSRRCGSPGCKQAYE